MELTFAPRGILQINNARIVHRNFAGEGSKYNRKGDRNFSLVIDDRYLTQDEMDDFLDLYSDFKLVAAENGPDVIVTRDGDRIEPKLVDVLTELGWNVKIKPPRDEEDDAFIFLPVKIKFNDRGPTVILVTGNRSNQLSEDTVDILDNIDIFNVSLDIRPYDWKLDDGKRGRTAYLQSMEIVQEIDRFMERHNNRSVD